MKRLIVVLALLAAPAHAARVVVCDAANNRVLRYDPSANTPEYAGNPNAIINPPSLPTLAGVPPHHWVCVARTDVREMTTSEKDQLAAVQAEEEADAIHESACGAFSGQDPTAVGLRALVHVLLAEINTLRSQHSLPPRTVQQAKAAICSAINNGTVDETAQARK